MNKYIQKIKKFGLKYAITVLVPNKIYYDLNAFLMILSKYLFGHLKVKNAIILESHNDFDSNGGAFYNWLLKNDYNHKYKIIWFLWNKESINLPKNVVCVPIRTLSLKKYYYLFTSKFILSCHRIIESHRSGQISLYMTHGPVGLKAFKGFTTVPKKVTFCLMPSKYLEPILADQYGMKYPNKKFKILGYPMHDYLYDNNCGDLHKITNRKFEKVILWMPTFRKDKDGIRNDSKASEKLGIPIFNNIDEYNELNRVLKKANALLIIKIHPMQDLSTIKIKNQSNIIVLNANSVKKLNVDNYRLMKDTDALISDYSSAAYDYLHLDKPIGYTIDDQKEYKLGFIIKDPEKLMGGQTIKNKKSFYHFIISVFKNEDPYEKKRHEVFNKVFKYHDGHSSERIAKFLDL